MRSSRSWRQPAESRAQSLRWSGRGLWAAGASASRMRMSGMPSRRYSDEGDAPQRLARVAALVTGRTAAGDQALALVEVEKLPRRPHHCGGHLAGRRRTSVDVHMPKLLVEVADRDTVLNVSGTALGVNSEVGALQAVILHRLGAELQRPTPRNNDALLFDGLPWVARRRRSTTRSPTCCGRAASRCCCCRIF